MATSRIPVSLNDHQRSRIETYADRHGASLAGAILALAMRQLDTDDAASAAAATVAAVTAARHVRHRKNAATQ